ncbi:hypothetical protein [Paenibacillus silvae]|uniref:Uncharacterized protein n=1 Tax=Paenibacillus silvae TaxID=1325358 RepID=A0A2W6Q5W7_9BACL|nr:hypothetical protein [Paenibacillus silvae]PZT52653.1 hypothetical protein DN757_26215 [Paenibacillus silvae]
MTMDKHENAMIQGSNPFSLSDVASLIKAGELDKSIPFMAYNRSTRRAAEKQAKKMICRSKQA